MFFDNVAKPIIPAKIGVEQGLEAKANKEPIKNGYKNRLLEFPFGNFLTIGEKLKSKIPIKFKPIIKIKEAKKSMKQFPPKDAKTLPVKAQIIPIIDKTKAKPKTKEDNCKNVLNLSLSPYPPT